MRRVGRCLQGSPFQSSVASSGLNNSADENDDDVGGSQKPKLQKIEGWYEMVMMKVVVSTVSQARILEAMDINISP